MDGEQWYYAAGGQQQGPVAVEVLRQLLAMGQLQPADLVWRQGMANWQPAASIPDLIRMDPVSAAAAPVAAPAYPVTYQMPGQPQMAPLPYAQANPNSQGKATTAFVLSLVGLFCFGIVLGPIAIVLAVRAKAQMARSGDYHGSGLATAALVIGIVDIVGFILTIVLQFAISQNR